MRDEKEKGPFFFFLITHNVVKTLLVTGHLSLIAGFAIALFTKYW